MKVVLHAKMPGKEVLFEVGKMHVSFGRGEGVHVQMPDTNCSRAHCKFYVENGKFWIEDMASKNGTMVNGIRIQKTMLFLEDKIKVGDTDISIPADKNTAEVVKYLQFDGDTDARQRKSLKLEDTSEFTQARLNPLTAIHAYKPEATKQGKLELEASPLFKNSMPQPRAKIAAPPKAPPSWMLNLGNVIDYGGVILAFALPFIASQTAKQSQNFRGLDDGFMGLKRITVVVGLAMFCSFVFWLINSKNSGGSLGERLTYILWYKNQKKS